MNIDKIRPETCPSCGGANLHTHGQYIRKVQEQNQSWEIPVFRFRCANLECKQTISVLPSFIGKHQRFTWDVQEEICVNVEGGDCLEQAARQIDTPVGPISPKTVWRWWKRCRECLSELEEEFWNFVLSIQPTCSLPRGVDRPTGILKRFQQIWKTLPMDIVKVRVLHGIYRLRQLHPI